ncbi:MAG: cell division protein FtsX [Sulfurimonas sp.]|nr:cell division protein FtsX [Sulfurimonas sp.]
MKSIKNHLSLVIALLSILFSIQIFTIVDRSVNAYKDNLATNYSLVVVSYSALSEKTIIEADERINTMIELSPDDVIQRLNTGMSTKNMELLKHTLPKFYKVKLKHYPSPGDIESVTKKLLTNQSVTKVENFSQSHDTTYKLLLLFKNVVSLFATSIFVITTLLIFKELRIWQFKHSERMSIMALFGAPTWLRSAVLFRLAITDALITSAVAFGLFAYMSSSSWVLKQFEDIDINIVLFDPLYDFAMLAGVAISLSILLATLIVLGHKEEV